MTRKVKQFTDKYIAALKPKEKKYVEREARGFAIQILPSGTKTFMYIFELNKSKGYLFLGTYPATSLAKARVAYNEAYNLVKARIDPRDSKREQAEKMLLEGKAAEDSLTAEATLRELTFQKLIEQGIPDDFIPVTVEQLAAVYYVKYSAPHHAAGTHKNLLYAIRKDFLQDLGHRKVSDVRRSDAIALIDKVANRAPGQAGNVLKAGQQIFEYALQREWVEIQPFLDITKAVKKAVSKPRERALEDQEIRQAWNEISQCSATESVKRALKLILVTAQREGEVVQMHRSQIDDDRWWTIPATVTKNKREHRVYLTDMALELIGDDLGYIFPARSKRRKHITGNSLAQMVNRGSLTDEVVKKVGSRKIKARELPYFGMTPWTPHDLRRTARTNMARIGISDEHAEEVLNHKKPSLVGTYNKYGYDKEKQQALIAWDGQLLRILNAKVEDGESGE